MLNVSYKNRIGYYIKTERYPKDEPVRKFKNWICHANCLWADMYFYKVDEDYERFGKKYKKGDKMAQLVCFFSDIKHLKTCLNNGIYDDCDNFHFYEEQMYDKIWSAVKILAKAGKKIIIETNKKK